MVESMFAMETFPSTLAVSALAVYLLGRAKNSVCGSNETCDSILSKSNMIALVSGGAAILLFLLITFGIIQSSQSMYGGMYGGF